jgi:mycothiol synthase
MREVRVLERFAPADVDAVQRLADEIEVATGAPPFGETTWLGLLDGGTRDDVGLLLPGADGILEGYAHVARHHADAWSLEAATRTDPESRRGEERASLVRAALDAVAEHGGGHVTMWAHAPTDDDDMLARQAGLTPERDLLQLRVPLPLVEPARWADGITVRAFVPGTDEDAWIVVNNRAFAGHPEQGNWARDILERREAEAWFDPSGFLLAFDTTDAADGADGALAGFCWTKVHPAHPPLEPDSLGEIYVIGVDPDRQGTGLGRALVVGGLDALAQRGITHGMLFVDADNAAAVGLYTALGFTTHRLDRAYGCDVAARA